MKLALKQQNKQQQGFTLIELVIVIVILGILAATAAPKFIDLQDDAKDSAIDGLKAALESAASLVYAKAIVSDEESQATGTVSVNTVTYSLAYGYPTFSAVSSGTDDGLGIDSLIDDDGFTSVAITNTRIFYRTGDTEPTAITDACIVYYQNSTSVTTRPTIASVDC